MFEVEGNSASIPINCENNTLPIDASDSLASPNWNTLGSLKVGLNLKKFCLNPTV